MKRVAWTVSAFACIAGSTGWAQATQRVSVAYNGAQGNYGSYYGSVSADGRFVAFVSDASNLVLGDTNGTLDVFLRDRLLGTTEAVSVNSSGTIGNGQSFGITMSADGRFVVFVSRSGNLVPADTNASSDVFVRDRLHGSTERVSVSSGGVQGDRDSGGLSTSMCLPSITPDGRYVSFSSDATNLVPGDTNNWGDVFVRDRRNGTTERVSVDSSGNQGNFSSGDDGSSISSDGRYLAFTSIATNLVPGDVLGFADVFVRDRQLGTTELISADPSGAPGNGSSGNSNPSISDDGRFVAFASTASNLVAGDTNSAQDIFVRDRQLGTTERVSVASGGGQGDGTCVHPMISADGRYVTFESTATNLIPGDTNANWDVFLRDRLLGRTERVSVGASGLQGDGESVLATISGDGRYVAFDSIADDLVPGDTNATWDVFIYDRTSVEFTSLCDPGAGSVVACSCSNPPAGTGRGCDNSAGTGGATLSATGIARLTLDTLTFRTSGEMPTAFSVVMQGHTLAASGIVFGQGVRCANGALKRLFMKTAVSGIVNAPDIGAGELPVSVRSAQLGDVIQPGQSRWYFVGYRDPVVLGGCPATSTFNATQTGRVDWVP